MIDEVFGGPSFIMKHLMFPSATPNELSGLRSGHFLTNPLCDDVGIRDITQIDIVWIDSPEMGMGIVESRHDQGDYFQPKSHAVNPLNGFEYIPEHATQRAIAFVVESLQVDIQHVQEGGQLLQGFRRNVSRGHHHVPQALLLRQAGGVQQLESQGLRVSRLIRVRFGPIGLPSDLRAGRFRDLSQAETRALYGAVDLPVPKIVQKKSRPRARRGRDERSSKLSNIHFTISSAILPFIMFSWISDINLLENH